MLGDMYLHYDDERDDCMTLHDCRADKASLEDGVLSFWFPDGFWITPKHEASHLEEIVRTDASEVRFRLVDENTPGVTVYVYTSKGRRKALREEWYIRQLVNRINKGECKLEFLYQYKDGCDRIAECLLWLKRKPRRKACNLYISADQVTYCWNHLREDRRW